MTLEQIRTDLNDIKRYYASKELFDAAFKVTGANVVLEKVKKYNEAMRYAQPNLYELYVRLYINHCSQRELADQMSIVSDYVTQLNKKLTVYLQENLNKGGQI